MLSNATTTSSSGASTGSSLFNFESATSDLLKQIRDSRRAHTYTSPPSRSLHAGPNKRKPFIVRWFIPAIIALLLLYILLFVEVSEFDILHLKIRNAMQSDPTAESSSPSELDDTAATATANDNTAHYADYKDEQSNEQFVAMWHYIHESDFSKLSPALQTRKLHELFRYKYADILVDRLRRKEGKYPTDYELAVILTDLYSSLQDSEVNFIQIGACDGNWQQSNDPIQKLVLSKPNWHGVMMEPVPYLFDTLKQNIAKDVVEYEHRIVAVNAALSSQDGTQLFYIVNEHFREELPNESHALKYQIGSFNKEHIVKHIGIKKERGQLKHELDHYITGIEVQAMTPNTVLEMFRQSGKAARDGSIDVLTIDAEGYDYMVLRQFLDHTSIRPLLIMYENLHLTQDDKQLAIQTLRQHGYLEFGLGWNTLGVRVANV